MSEKIAKDIRAVSYLRTSSAANVHGDSEPRQREAVRLYAARAGLTLVDEFRDPAISGADSLDQRPGFADLLARCRESGVRTILVENASRFARDLVVQETGYALLKAEGYSLIAVDDPDAFLADTPTACMVRQILGAVAQFEKTNLVSKLRGARDRLSSSAGRRIEGRKGHAARNPDVVREAKRLARRNPKTGKTRSLREIADELAALGFVTSAGSTFGPGQVQRLLNTKT